MFRKKCLWKTQQKATIYHTYSKTRKHLHRIGSFKKFSTDSKPIFMQPWIITVPVSSCSQRGRWWAGEEYWRRLQGQRSPESHREEDGVTVVENREENQAWPRLDLQWVKTKGLWSQSHDWLVNALWTTGHHGPCQTTSLDSLTGLAITCHLDQQWFHQGLPTKTTPAFHKMFQGTFVK